MSCFLSRQVYRHGDRSPTHIYPNDPYQEDVWPQGIGMLTQVSAGKFFQIIQLDPTAEILRQIKTQLENQEANDFCTISVNSRHQIYIKEVIFVHILKLSRQAS